MKTLICVSCGYEEKASDEDTDAAKVCPDCNVQVLAVKTKTTSHWASGEPEPPKKSSKKK